MLESAEGMKILDLQKIKKSEAIKKAVQVLSSGGILIYPTETAYGIGVDATNQKAVDQVLNFKARMTGKPLSVAVCDQKMAERFVQLNQAARSLYQNFLPGPITVVSKSLGKVAKGVASEQGKLGIRIPDYQLILEIIKKFNRPITATSANLSGDKTPYSVEDVLKNSSGRRKAMIDLILDAGQLPKRPTSTVVDTTLDDYQILRRGAIKIKNQKSKIKSKEKVYKTKSPEETQKIARDILLYHAKVLKPRCLIFTLEGNLGSGKTQFAKGLGQALNIKEPITSPTFSLVHEYPIPSQPSTSSPPSCFYHIDTWRLLDPKELDDLELDSMIKPGNVIAIEWAEKLAHWPLIAGNWQLVKVKLEHKSETHRLIRIRF